MTKSHCPSPCRFPQEFTSQQEFRVLCELKCPHRRSQMCWMTGYPHGFLPTQTYSCFPNPAASFALCKPPQYLQSVGLKKMKVSNMFFVNLMSFDLLKQFPKRSTQLFLYLRGDATHTFLWPSPWASQIND